MKTKKTNTGTTQETTQTTNIKETHNIKEHK